MRKDLLLTENSHRDNFLNMGDTQSTQKTQKTTMEDILIFLEEEVKKWGDNSKNLKETWKKKKSGWVPVYLKQQMEETETRWTNIKSMIPFQEEPGGQFATNRATTQLQICCRQALRKAETEINQLKKNNQTLISNIQATEKELTGKKKTIEKLQIAQIESLSKDAKASSVKTDAGNALQNDNQDVKQGRQQLDCKICSAKDEIIETLRNEGKNKEDTIEKERSELNRQIEELMSVKKSQQERIRNLEQKTEELSREIDVSEKRETEAANQHNEETLQKTNNGRQSPKDHVVQKLQKQKEDMTEKFQVEKLKLIEESQILTAQNESLVYQVGELEKEKEALLLRLSKIAGDKLIKNNSAITDLSDPNRPTKLGEVYSEIYDNEWTDAYEALKEAGHEDEAAIETLRLTLQHVMQFCESNADLLIKKSSNAVNLLFEEYDKPACDMKKTPQLTMQPSQARQVGKLLRQKSSIEDIKFQQRWKPIKVSDDKSRKVKENPEKAQEEEKSNLDVDNKLKQLRREMATYMVPLVQKAYMDANWSNEYIDGLQSFILKCVFLAWMMIVQSPPMSLHKYPCEEETKFDKNFYKEYTASGPLVRYVVWPALLLQEDGPVVCKGVAEGKAGIKRSTSQNS